MPTIKDMLEMAHLQQTFGDLRPGFREHENFKFHPVLSEPGPEDAWTGRTGLVHEAILQDFPSLAGNEIYACGSVRMVEAIFPKLKGQGAEEGMCFSDAFTISARSMAIQAPAEEPGN